MMTPELARSCASGKDLPREVIGRVIAHCHIHIREIAKASSRHLYHRLMVDDRCYQVWRRQNPDGGPQETQAAVC